MDRFSNAIRGRLAIRSAHFHDLVDEYEQRLVRSGYNKIVVRFHLHAVVHFAVWLELEDHKLREIDEETLRSFERHRTCCTCLGTSRNRARQVLSCVRRFLLHLRQRGVAQRVEVRPQPVRLVADFLQWMKVHRGVVETTLTSYAGYVGNLVRVLGDDPRTYTARGLRDFVETGYRHYRSTSLRMVLAAVRMFLRYLVVEGKCRPGLEHALTSVANWSQQSLPQGLTPEEIQRVLAACPPTTRGLRDRAALLLLIRLGLRAGDVSKLRFSDLCFETATIQVSGKGRREVRLPLPQDVGDALLEYLRAERSRIQSEFVFLRSIAPFQPFSMRQAGKGIGHIARAALQRAGVQPPRRGSHVFRHTAACQMLRQGVNLEGIAEVLRHRSVATTGIYAKVDLELLGQIAQPWPEDASC
jgi:site-specific recombinase XerD